VDSAHVFCSRLNAFVERIHASGVVEISIRKLNVIHAHLTVRFGSKRTGYDEHAREQHARRAGGAL
jgi:hypothetical protein